jgi:hypothetical protein
MTVRELWVGGVFVLEWDLVTVTAGAPLTAATVTGVARRPDGTSAAMTIDHVDGSHTWRATYSPTAAGEHGYRLTAEVDGVPAGAVAGSFVVSRESTGAPPITLDPTSPIGQVRLLVTDLNEVAPLFTDPQITAFLVMEGHVVKRAAATALETIARSEVLIAKRITTQDLSTDGPSVGRELRESAKQLRAQAAAEVELADDFAMDVVDFDPLAAYRWGW